MSREKRDLRSMADLLKSGAALTERACPACSSPLFRLRTGELWCAQCQKPVVVIREGEQPAEAARPTLLSSLESTVLAKVQELDREIQAETSPQRLQTLSAVLSSLLESLERIRRLKGA